MPDTGMEHYCDQHKKDMVPEWDLEYKNQILTQLITMLADMKPTCNKMDGLLHLGQTNPYNVTLAKMTTRTMYEVKEQQKNNPRKKYNDTTETKNDPKKKEGVKVSLHVGSNTTTLTDDAPTTDNNEDCGKDAKEEPSNTTTEPAVPNGQAGLALSYDNNTLMAEEAWDLIKQDHMDGNKQDSNDHTN